MSFAVIQGEEHAVAPDAGRGSSLGERDVGKFVIKRA
jgi:hypothetical protein